MRNKDPFPTLGMEEFRQDEAVEAHLQYHELRGKRLIDKPHKHDFLVLLLVEKGSGIHAIDFIDYPVAGCQVHLLFPGQVHRWELDAGTVAYQLMISHEIYEAFSESLAFSFVLFQHQPVIPLEHEAFQKLLYECRSIQQELSQRPVNWTIISLRCKLLAQLVSREAESRFDNLIIYRTAPVLLRYYALVDAHFKEQKSVAFYAGQLHITANYLNILCQRHLQQPATFLIQSRVTLEARRLLKATDLSIKEIAFELGFSDAAYFSNFFKSQAGLAPRDFRRL